MDKVRVYIKNPGSAFFEAEIDNTLEAFQAAVGGYIEVVSAYPEGRVTPGVVIVCDEEGMLKGRQYNCELNGVLFFGTVVISGTQGENFVDCPEGYLNVIEFTQED